MKLMEKVIAQAGGGGGAKIVFTVPLPRYVLVANHVSNRQDPEFLTEIFGSVKCLPEARRSRRTDCGSPDFKHSGILWSARVPLTRLEAKIVETERPTQYLRESDKVKNCFSF